jgi:hypothetical protein
MNPIAFLIVILGILLIIVGVKGSYKNLKTSLQNLLWPRLLIMLKSVKTR